MTNSISEFVRGYKKTKSLCTICREQGLDILTLEDAPLSIIDFLERKGFSKEEIQVVYINKNPSENKAYSAGAAVYIVKAIRNEFSQGMREMTKEYLQRIRHPGRK
jgi:hypothetical protein